MIAGKARAGDASPALFFVAKIYVSNRELKKIEPLYYETYQEKHDETKRENDINNRTVIDGSLGPIFAINIRWHWNLPGLTLIAATRM